MKKLEVFRNTMGAFSDAAVLFPLLVLFSRASGFSSNTALLTTGIAYLVSAMVFRVPMSVQPLKSIAVASIVVGASFSEIRLSGLLLGVVCVLVSLLDVNRFARKVPDSIIHQLQVGLGILLVLQGVQSGFEYGIFLLAAFMVLLPEIRGIPVLGLVATGGLFYGILHPQMATAVYAGHSENVIRPGLVLSLLLPQLVLTSGNSILATRNVCERYFGAAASSRVTIRRLLLSIGFGNIAVSIFGGMPFCHGSGGVTAHVKGGSTRAWSTALMGVVLLFLAGLQVYRGGKSLIYPPVLISSLLMATGFFHLKLASPTLQSRLGWIKLGAAVVITLWTRNLLWVLAAAALFEGMVVLTATRKARA